jgi:hypothetical protein
MDVDDLLSDAQDAYFANDIQTTISKCEEILSQSTKEADAYDLITISYFQLNPPQYKKALEYALQWQANCGEDNRQLNTLIKSSYHLDDFHTLQTAAQRVANLEGEGNLLRKAFVASLLVDAGITDSNQSMKEFGQSIAQECQDLLESSNYLSGASKEDSMRLQSLLCYASSAPISQLEALVQNHQGDGQSSSLGLPISLLCIAKLESGEDLDNIKEYLEVKYFV